MRLLHVRTTHERREGPTFHVRTDDLPEVSAPSEDGATRLLLGRSAASCRIVNKVSGNGRDVGSSWDRVLDEDSGGPRPFEPEYERWRHGGWYVSNVRYPSGAVGCVSNNYADKKWRIVCGPHEATFSSRGDAAAAEYAMVEAMKKATDAASKAGAE